jgi:hypothetical protein
MDAIFAEALGGVGTVMILGTLQLAYGFFTSKEVAHGCRSFVMVLIKMVLAPIIGFFLTVLTFVVLGDILDPTTDIGSGISLVLIIGWTAITWTWLSKGLR